MKVGLNKTDQVRLKKMVADGLTAAKIAKILRADLDVVKRFVAAAKPKPEPKPEPKLTPTPKTK